jgi:hypothetical protein
VDVRAELPPSLWATLHRLTTGEEWPPSAETAGPFVHEAGRQGLLPLLFAEPDPPPAVAGALEQVRAWEALEARRARIYGAALERLATLFAGEPFLLLKGADYAWRLYGRPEWRPMQDLDVLVPPARFAAACARLREAGFAPHYAWPVQRVASHHEKAWRRDGLIVEVHQRFIQPARHRIDYEAIWRRVVPLAGPTFRAARLSDVDALVYHALSMALDEFRVRLVRYVDLWLMLRAGPAAAAAAVGRAREWSARRALYGAFRQALRLFPELAGGELPRLAEALLPARTRAFVDRLVLPPLGELTAPVGPGRGRQLWRKFGLLDTPARRCAFAIGHVPALLAGHWLAYRARRGVLVASQSPTPPAPVGGEGGLGGVAGGDG